ncbi:MAG: ATP synthase F0 subunit B [Desulfatiglandales bacterium]
MLKIDYTLLVQIANFLFLLIILNLILYRPIRDVLRKRRAEMESLEGGIEDLQDQADDLSYDLEENLAGARREGVELKESIRHQGIEEERGMVQEAGNTAGDRIAEARAEMESKLAAARQSLENELAAFSRELAGKLLGRSV